MVMNENVVMRDLKSFRSLEETVGNRTEDLYKKLPCLVCGASASGIHFGAVTCEACKVSQLSEHSSSFKDRTSFHVARVSFVDLFEKMLLIVINAWKTINVK